MSPMASQITSVLIVFSTIYIQGTENIKAPRYRPLWGETTGDRWFPITKDQWRGKYFHLMTSSWIKVIHYLAVAPRLQWTQRTESLVPPTRLHYPTDSLEGKTMTSSNRNVFRVTGPLCGEITSHRWIPSQRSVTRNFDVFFDLRLGKCHEHIEAWTRWPPFCTNFLYRKSLYFVNNNESQILWITGNSIVWSAGYLH